MCELAINIERSMLVSQDHELIVLVNLIILSMRCNVCVLNIQMRNTKPCMSACVNMQCKHSHMRHAIASHCDTYNLGIVLAVFQDRLDVRTVHATREVCPADMQLLGEWCLG
jgi:hypothetical protein